MYNLLFELIKTLKEDEKINLHNSRKGLQIVISKNASHGLTEARERKKIPEEMLVFFDKQHPAIIEREPLFINKFGK